MPASAGHRGTDVQTLLAASRLIDAINLRIGKWMAWLILLAVAVSAGNAVVRKLLDVSSNAWLELQWVLFSMVFLLCAPWTLQVNEHIRIDIVNSAFPRRIREMIDIVGQLLFLLPLTVVMMVTSLPFFRTSLATDEQSLNAGGLPAWPAKSLLVIGFSLLFLQGLSELIKRVAVMRGIIPDPHAGGAAHAAEAEAERLLGGLKPEAR
jgi:TRAP-type mannitol/chloroaromatic compound transport system permease small subunit